MTYNMQPIVKVMDEAIKKLKKLMKKTSQKKEIRRYLEAGGKLTAMAALNFWGCWNLKGRIFDIREDYHEEWLNDLEYPGVPLTKMKRIKTEMVKTNSGKIIAEYSIKRVD